MIDLSLVPSSDGGDDFVGVCGPVKGLGSALVSARKRLMAAWRSTTERKTAFQAAPGQPGEEAHERIEPGTRGWREVEDEALVPVEPGADLGMLVGGVVVEDDVDHLAGRHLGLDCVLKPHELRWRWRCMLRPMTVPSRTLSAAKRVVVQWRL